MKFLKQFLIIVTVSLLGELLNSIIPLPVPASIYGILIMLFLLITGLLKLGSVKETADFLIAIMPIMFIPAAVGVIQVYGDIKDNLLAYLVVTVVSTVAVMAVSGIVTELVMKMRNKRGNGK